MEGKKAASFCILKVLQEYSDEHHPLKQSEIGELVKKYYDISLDRKSIGNTINMLEELDYDIIKLPGGGVYLNSRVFDESMVSFLIDAIFSSKSITGSQAKDLSKAITSTLSSYDKKKYEYAIFKSAELTRTNNREALFNASIIQEAIQKKKRIAFNYLEYNEFGKLVPSYNGYEYHASPYYLVNNYGNYYCLLGRHKHLDGISAFRLDKMSNLRIYEEDQYGYEPITTITPYKDGFNISTYLNEHVYLFNGEVSKAIVALKKPSDQQYVREWFGNVKTYKRDGQLVAEFTCDESALYYWALQYSEHATVLLPETVVNKIKTAVKEIYKDYK